jgi:hypothetical protein
MNSFKILAALALLVVAADVTSARLNLNRFFSSLRPQSKVTCDWLADPSKLKELNWNEQVDLCFETGPNYIYPHNDVETAFNNDYGAQIFYQNTQQCYSYQNQQYYHPWNNLLYSQDLCPVRHQLVDKVWRWNRLDNKMDHCYIVRPEEQRVAMAQCGDGSSAGGANPNSQKCKRDFNSYFEGNYYCVPDGYVQRVVLVYCPWDPEVQCIPAQVKIPTGCSCKQYTCDKARASALGGLALPSLGK